MPTVSIITPTFNRAALLGETLDGIQAQTLTDWECWVVDDGSTDETQAVVDRYAASDPRIHYVSQGKQGRTAAWNRGAALATGEYLALLDDDDVWLPNFLAVLVDLLRRSPGAVVAACPQIAWDGEKVLDVQVFDTRTRAAPRRAMIRRCFVNPSQCVVVRAVMEKTKGFRGWPTDDYDFWMQILPHGQLALADEALMQYRRHAGSDSLAPGLAKARQYGHNNARILTEYALHPRVPFSERVLALANAQRQYEHLLELDVREGLVPQSLAARFLRLLRIFPTPLLRSPRLSWHYLSYRASVDT